MRTHVVFRYTGFVFLFNATFLLISSVISALNSDSALFPLLYSFTISALFGAFPMIFVPSTMDINNKEGFVIVVASWLLSCLIGVMPYILWGGEFTFTNVWFESVSGFTSTGSTIITNIEAIPPGLLFWRSTTHWIGGIGIIIFVLSALPSMGKAGMILYRSEISPFAMENFHYRTKRTLKILLYVYIGLTALETISLFFCGMTLFDSITHAFGTIVTGGFSTKNLSIAYYRSGSIEIVIMIFMILPGLHFGLLFGAITGKISNLWRSSIVKYYILTLLIGVCLTALSVHGGSYDSWAGAFRYASFQVISVGTSTGFATADSSLWPPFAQLLMIFFTLQCACAGSTSGGIKVDRIVIFWKATKKRIGKIKHPSAVITPKINKMVIDEDVLEMTVLYIPLYIGIVFLSSLLLTTLGVDLLTAFSGSAATMGNVGPGFGMVGSMDNFSRIPDAGKWILSATMLLGRLEIFGLLVLIMAKTWK